MVFNRIVPSATARRERALPQPCQNCGRGNFRFTVGNVEQTLTVKAGESRIRAETTTVTWHSSDISDLLKLGTPDNPASLTLTTIKVLTQEGRTYTGRALAYRRIASIMTIFSLSLPRRVRSQR